MKLVRTFHPVGHGAFYTEQFYKGDKCVFTAVYDCGGNPEGGLKNYIDNNFKEGKINAFFISHLHNDHISGLEYIIDRCEKVFLPALTPNQQMEAFVQNIIATDDFNNYANDFIKNAFGGVYDGKLAFVEQYEGERHDHNPEEEDVEIENVGTTLKAGVPLTSNKVPFWIYYPYNSKYDLLNKCPKELTGAIVNGKVDFEGVKRVCQDEDNFKSIKKWYKENKDGGLYNEYSMTVYSGYYDFNDYGHLRKFRQRHKITEELWIDDLLVCRHYTCSNGFCSQNPNCLFTGDYVASEENVYKLKKFYGGYYFNSATLQIPHHCSDKLNKKDDRYGLSLFNNRNDVVMSIKYGQFAGIPSEYLLSELRQKEQSIQIVTEKRNSCFEQVFRVY